MSIRYAATLCVSFAFAGCAAGPVPLDRMAIADVHKVTLIGPQEPRLYSAIGSGTVLGLAAGSAIGGAVGGAVVAGAASAGPTDFNGQMQNLKLNLGEEMRSAISRSLARDGYAVDENVVPRFGANLLSKYDDVSSKGSDAILDAMIVAGYIGEKSFSSAYTPYVHVEMRIVEAKSRRVLFKKDYIYSASSPNLPSEPSFTFMDGKDLLADPQRAAVGLRTGVSRIAAEIERDLVKQ